MKDIQDFGWMCFSQLTFADLGGKRLVARCEGSQHLVRESANHLVISCAYLQDVYALFILGFCSLNILVIVVASLVPRTKQGSLATMLNLCHTSTSPACLQVYADIDRTGDLRLVAIAPKKWDKQTPVTGLIYLAAVCMNKRNHPVLRFWISNWTRLNKTMDGGYW